MSIIDQEIKRLFITLITACLFITGLIWVAANSNAFFSFTSNVINTVTGQKSFDKAYSYNLDKNKIYSLEVVTNQGTMTFELNKDIAPNTVNNIVNLVKDGFYKNMNTTPLKTEQYILVGTNQQKQLGYKIDEEINAKALGLDKITVGQYYDALKNTYDSSLLNDNLSKSVMDFYESIGYKYNSDLNSKVSKKGSLIMYSETPGNFKNEFLISTTGNIPQFEGRMTNFGELSSGEDVLNKIASASVNDIVIYSFNIKEK